jgi:MFS family permease
MHGTTRGDWWMREYTKKGLLLMIIGMVIGIGTSCLSAAGIQVVCLPFLSALIIFIGFVLMVIGRNEFGERHARFVIWAFVTFIIGFVIVIAGAVVIAYGGVESISYEGTREPEINYTILSKYMRTGLITIIIGTIIIAIGQVLLVYDLEHELGKKLLILAACISIVISGMTYSYINTRYQKFVADVMATEDEQEFEGAFKRFERDTNKVQAFSVIGAILFLVAYIIPYMRIVRGELQPTLPTPPTPMITQLPHPEMPERTCRYCHTALRPDEIYCHRCGRRI